MGHENGGMGGWCTNAAGTVPLKIAATPNVEGGGGEGTAHGCASAQQQGAPTVQVEGSGAKGDAPSRGKGPLQVVVGQVQGSVRETGAKYGNT